MSQTDDNQSTMNSLLAATPAPTFAFLHCPERSTLVLVSSFYLPPKDNYPATPLTIDFVHRVVAKQFDDVVGSF